MSKTDYEIGFGKPPKHTQFKKGQSGNPRGRPKGARGLKTDLRAELSELVSITENGRKRRLTKQRLILKAIWAKAAKGDPRAAQLFINLTIDCFGIEGEQAAAKTLSQNDAALLEEYVAELLKERGDA